MRNFERAARLLGGAACALVLAACGGGGGDSAPASTAVTPEQPATPAQPAVPDQPVTPAKPDQSWLTLTPSRVDATTYAGEEAIVWIEATSSRTFARPVNVAVVDPSGVLAPDIRIGILSDLEYQAELRTSALLPPGRHSATVELRLCEDDPKVCKVPVAGSPWLIPVTVDVRSAAKNLTALSDLPNVANWSAYQGNASHDGYVPATFDAGRFSRRWAVPASTISDETLQLAHDNGRTFASLTDRRARATFDIMSKAMLVAFSEQSGEELWRKDFGPAYRLNPPAAANGKVYVTGSDCCGTFFWMFDQATGKVLGKMDMVPQLYRNYGPTIFGDAAYASSGSFYAPVTTVLSTALARFGTTTLTWQASLPAFDYWSPAVDGTHAYAYVGGKLHAVATGNGQPAFTVADPDDAGSYGRGTTVALSGNGMAFVVSNDQVRAFDLARRRFAWRAGRTAYGMPVVARNVVYTLAEGVAFPDGYHTAFEARDAATGALLWTSGPLPSLSHSMVVTDNLAFVSGQYETVAIDLATHQQVWQHPAGGRLSISKRGVLHIGGEEGKIVAINLR